MFKSLFLIFRNAVMFALVQALFLSLILTAAVSAQAQSQIVPVPGHPGFFTIVPYTPGYSLPEPPTQTLYGLVHGSNAAASFPEIPLPRGVIKIPVLLVDWSDFNPESDPSNHTNPTSVYPGYQQKSPQELSAYLNSAQGPAGYYQAISGGQLRIQFDVYPWLVSDQTTYLKDKEPNYYYFDQSTNRWTVKPVDYALDVLRSAIVDLGVDFRNYDADGNKVLDGLIIVYEGQGEL